MAQPPESRY